jgi:dihydropteroate synthase
MLRPSADPPRGDAGRAGFWRLPAHDLPLGSLPLVMGIVNVTPDSFSDGGRFLSHHSAVAQALKLLDEGADILDIGGESTRPYSTPVPADEELRRVQPVVEAVRRLRPKAVISIDTSKAAVATAALAAGAQIVNDITGLRGDPQMLPLVREAGAGICLMHMQGTPQTMQDNPTYGDLIGEIHDFLRARRDALEAAGIERERICLDPGIGFGKTHEHNITLMVNCWRFHELGCPLLVGHSRKAFIGKLIGNKQADRTAGTIGGALALARQGVQIIRVHDVGPVRQALTLFAACGGLGNQWPVSDEESGASAPPRG